jgi:S1-C subfamily serine protease
MGTAVVLVAAMLLAQTVPDVVVPPPLVVSNGHDIVPVVETILAETEDLTLPEIFERSEAGVVRVNVDGTLPGMDGVGSGFVYDRLGHIITNEHVISNSERITVTFLDGRSYDAERTGSDQFTDIAVIRVEADRSLLHPLTLGDSSSLRVGEQVAAIGNPFGLAGSMTSGIVSQIGRLLPTTDSPYSIPDVIQTDAAINPGNSGGPLLNMRGEVVGINTAIQSNTGEFVGVGFAVPSQTAAKIVPELIMDGQYIHPWIGIVGQDIDIDLAAALGLTDARGFIVMDVVPESPAADAGLRGATGTKTVDGVTYRTGGDIIILVDGQEVRQIHDILVHLQRNKAVGDEMVLQVLRDGAAVEVTVLLGSRPQE